MDGKERKRRDKSNKNEGEGEGPRTGREIRRPPNESIDDNAPTEEEIKALIEEGVKRLEGFNANEFWGKELEWWISVKKRLENNGLLELVDVVEGINKYIETVMRWYAEHVNTRELIEQLRSHAIVRKYKRSFSVQVREKYVTLIIRKVNGGLAMSLLFKELRGIVFNVPGALSHYEIMLRRGLEGTDAWKEKNRIGMATTHRWQVMLWLALNPGNNYVKIEGIDLNKKRGPKLRWIIYSERESEKERLLELLRDASDAELRAFAWGMVLGDGTISFAKDRNKVKPQILIYYGVKRKYHDYLKQLGFVEGKKRYIITTSKAANFAKTLLSEMPLKLKILFDILEVEKWERLRRVAEFTYNCIIIITLHGTKVCKETKNKEVAENKKKST